jgi:MFS family permease
MASTNERAARLGTTAVFFLTGAVSATWSTRIPAIQERLHLTPAALSVSILGLEGGALVGLPMGGALVARLGSRWCLRAGFAVYPTALLAAAAAPSLAVLAMVLAIMATANSVVDVAMNAQGVELERRYDRPILSSLHASHSAGLLAGSLAGTAAAAAGMAPLAHFATVAVLGVLASTTATCRLLDEPASRSRLTLARPTRPLLLLGVVAFCGFLLDGAASNWSAVHLRIAYDASPALAAAAFTVFTAMLALGRLTSDRLTGRLGRIRVVQLAGVLSAAGVALAVTAPTAATSLVGWGVFGLGLAAVAPTVLGAAAGVRDVPAPVAIAAVTTVGYLGSFTGAPLIGVIAQFSTVPAALRLLAAVSLLATLLAWPALNSVDHRMATAKRHNR